MSSDKGASNGQIAELLARINMIKEVTDRTIEKVNNIEHKTIRAELHIRSINKRLSVLEPQMQELFALKYKSQGMIIVIGTIFGVIGSIIMYLLKG